MICFPCPECGAEISVRYLKGGESAKCPSCGALAIVPATGDPSHSAWHTKVTPGSPMALHEVEEASHTAREMTESEYVRKVVKSRRVMFRAILIYMATGFYLMQFPQTEPLPVFMLVGLSAACVAGVVAFVLIAYLNFLMMCYYYQTGILYISPRDTEFWKTQKRFYVRTGAAFVILELAYLLIA